MTERYTEQDLLLKDKLEVSSFLIYKKEYRELSNDAKLMYQYLIKRFSLTQRKLAEAIEENTMDKFTFVDENGELFCYVSNDELRFVLNISEPTVKKCKKQLEAVGLLDDVKQTAHKTNRLYVKKVSVHKEDQVSFRKELVEFRQAEWEKRKAKNSKRKEKKAPVKKAETVEPSSEPKNIKFSEPKNVGFMNQNNFGLSTKEELSTTESISTKESQSVSLCSVNNIDSELNEIPDQDLPMYVKKIISVNKKRLTDDNINVYEILAFYKSSDNTLVDPDDFTEVLSNVLTRTKGKINSFSAVMKKAIHNWYEEYTGNVAPLYIDEEETIESAGIDKDKLPEYLKYDFIGA
ncbi:replication initiator protein A [Bacillus cereus group sp. TH36-2LC]|uniref:replication initiator protein A n=1 Tax=Bacillus cereus group sp. TH36-2LC TaxID=3018040 RepID=UPI0022E649CA|nr:replication initiator protein A [Bacillus cereus group sp. TH36-2LC]MDA1509652.1 replication initiator protein A [Bacillus cereus group sp. TH36-2LC]